VEAPLAALHAGIAAYYTDKVTRFGATPAGVDWTCVPTQEMRFVQLLKLSDFATPFSLNDVGCGYGALLGFLDWRYPGCAVEYTGVDLSAAMIRRAQRRWRGRPGVRFVRGHVPPARATWSVASGIFNVQLEQPRPAWEAFIAATLHDLNATSALGFAVNFVHDRVTRRGLYTAHPERWADHCTTMFGAATEVIDGYGLPEFTLLVRRRHNRTAR
jgi:SAM-dependent methyltransferase